MTPGRVARPAPDRVGAGELALVRFGLRFADGGIEAAYRTWHREAAVPFVRVGMYASILCWGLASLGVYLVDPARFPRAMALVAWAIPMIAAALLISYRASLRRWMLPFTMLANTVAGLVALVLCYRILFIPEIAVGGVCVW